MNTLLLLGLACAPDRRTDTADTAEYCDIDCKYEESCPDQAENGWSLYQSSDYSVTSDLVRRARCMFGQEIEIEVNGETLEDCLELVEGDRNGELDWDTAFETCDSF